MNAEHSTHTMKNPTVRDLINILSLMDQTQVVTVEGARRITVSEDEYITISGADKA